MRRQRQTGRGLLSGDAERDPTNRVVSGGSVCAQVEGVAKMSRRRVRGEWISVLRRDPCSYCGKRGGTIDHIVAESRGGHTVEDNLTGACHKCNQNKGDRSLLGALSDLHWDGEGQSYRRRRQSKRRINALTHRMNIETLRMLAIPHQGAAVP